MAQRLFAVSICGIGGERRGIEICGKEAYMGNSYIPILKAVSKKG